jgi:hypothetical protein
MSEIEWRWVIEREAEWSRVSICGGARQSKIVKAR